MESIIGKRTRRLIAFVLCLGMLALLCGCGSSGSGSNGSGSSAGKAESKQPTKSEIEQTYYADACPVSVAIPGALYNLKGQIRREDGELVQPGDLLITTAVAPSNTAPKGPAGIWSQAELIVTIYDKSGNAITSYDMSGSNDNNGTEDTDWVIEGFVKAMSDAGEEPYECDVSVYYIQFENGTSWGCPDLLDYDCASSVITTDAFITDKVRIDDIG